MSKIILRAFLLCAILPFYAVSQSVSETGELTIYPMYTQIGTIARRTFRDNQGRITKEIFYTGTPLSRPPYTEGMLKVQSVVLHTYNERGQVVRREHYRANMKLDYIWEIHYDGENQRREMRLSPQGIKTYEIRYSGNSTRTHLYYDDSGKLLRSIRGVIPGDIDLPFGWGETVAGLACGIVAVREPSWIDEAETYAIYINIKNSGTYAGYLHQLPPPIIELRDNRGNLVTASPDKEKKQKVLSQLRLYESVITPEASSAYLYPAYDLRAQYADLAPGRYTLRVKQPVSEINRALVSNEAFIEISGREK